MSKPDWKDAPEWAMWLAQDESGSWCWFVGAPIMMNSLWMPGDEENGDGDTYEWVDCRSGDSSSWRHSLERRP